MAKLKMHIRRGDIVKAISGADADGKKTGKVLKVYPETNRALVDSRTRRLSLTAFSSSVALEVRGRKPASRTLLSNAGVCITASRSARSRLCVAGDSPAGANIAYQVSSSSG